jgi:hypothetical protein
MFLTGDPEFPDNGFNVVCRNPAKMQHGEPIALAVVLNGTSGLSVL